MIWIVGAGPLAFEYSKVLKAINVKYIVIGRSKK
jgi:pyruvate/2-oxoglutarate dehydrogenase complex dihydrolipoamide dehydrogenase (E3) component